MHLQADKGWTPVTISKQLFFYEDALLYFSNHEGELQPPVVGEDTHHFLVPSSSGYETHSYSRGRGREEGGRVGRDLGSVVHTELVPIVETVTFLLASCNLASLGT